jgi:hypothetical protein
VTFKFSGYSSRPGKFIVINEDDWAIEKVDNIEPGNYEVSDLTFGKKTVITKSIYGSSLGYGKVVPLSTLCDEEEGQTPVIISELPDYFEEDDSVEVTISGGCGPYMWDTDNPDFEWEDPVTSGTTNTLTCIGTGGGGGDVSIKDAVGSAGVNTSGEATINMQPAWSDATGGPVFVVFSCHTDDCYTPGTTSSINIIPSQPVISVIVLSAGCTGGGTGPISLTAHESRVGVVAVQVNMRATGYNGNYINGSAVMSVDKCVCNASESGSITYTTTQMEVGEQQSIGIESDTPECFSLEISSGGGNISGGVYTAPPSNTNCEGNPTIVLRNHLGDIVDTLSIAVNGDTVTSSTVVEVRPTCCEQQVPGQTTGPCGGFCNHSPSDCCYGVWATGYGCSGNQTAYFAYGGMYSYCWWDQWCAGYTQTTIDNRTEQMKENGCCPAELL